MNEMDKVSPITLPAAKTPLELAIESKASPSELLQFMELQKLWEANEAKKAYVVAMNEFKLNPPEIFKDKKVDYGEGKTKYDHASLENVNAVIISSLAEHGFSHRWDTEQIDGGQIRVTCVITHILGHSEFTPLQSGADQSGGKNNIQAIGSTLTYLQRYTLLSATGLAVKGMDDDGKKSEPEPESITEDQCNTIHAIHALVTDNDLGADRLGKLLKSCYQVSDLADLPATHYKSIISKINTAIEAKRDEK